MRICLVQGTMGVTLLDLTKSLNTSCFCTDLAASAAQRCWCWQAAPQSWG